MNTQIAPDNSSTRNVLAGIPKIGYIQREDGSWEMAPFASSIRSALAYMGEQITYDEVMAYSGAAFRMVWNTIEWDGGNSDVAHSNGDPLEPFRRVFDTAGYEVSFYGREENRGSRHFGYFHDYLNFEAMRDAILASINRNVPPIALGVIGPPECCVIAGYDESGDVLVGWNYWQGDPGWESDPDKEESGYFRKRSWYEKTEGLVLIGQKTMPLEGAEKRS